MNEQEQDVEQEVGVAPAETPEPEPVESARADNPLSEDALDQAMAQLLDPEDAILTERFGWVRVRQSKVGDTIDSRAYAVRAKLHHEKEGVPTKQKLLAKMRKDGVYTIEDERRLRDLEQQCIALEAAIEEARTREDEVTLKSLKDQYDPLRTELEFINNPLQVALDDTAEGLAENERQLMVVTRCCTRKYDRDDQIKDFQKRLEFARRSNNEVEIARCTRMLEAYEGMPPFKANDRLWEKVAELKEEEEDESINAILSGYGRVRQNLPLRFSGLLPEEEGEQDKSGEDSGE